jgi:hypothetical protein
MYRAISWTVAKRPTFPDKKKYSRFAFILLLVVSFAALAGDFARGMQSMEKGDFAEAYCIWRPLAEQGHQDAAYHLGWLYANGNGLKVDAEKAIYWWTESADQGHTDAQFALGLAYTTGEGIKKSEGEALRWYLMAAKGGHEDAREMIRVKVRTGAEVIHTHLDYLITQQWLGQTVRVKAGKANLRSGPGTDNRLIGRVEVDTLLIAIYEKDGWYQVIRPDDLSYGWIAGWLTVPSLK